MAEIDLITGLVIEPKQAEEEGKKAGTVAGRGFSKKFDGEVSKGIGPIGIAIGATIAAGVSEAIRSIGQIARESINDLRNFSKGVAEINSILPANEKLTKDATNALINFSSQFATGPSTQARAFYNIVSAGVKGTANQLETLQTANTAAVAGLVSIDDSAKLLVSSVNAYAKSGLTAKQASDSLFVAVREGQTTFGELANFLGNVTGVAASAGLQFSELTGAVAAFTKQGLNTDVAVTGIRQVLVSVLKPTKEAADEAKRLGIEFSTTGLKAKGFANFIKEIADRTGGSSESLAKLFGNVRALTPILTTVNGNFNEFKRILGETANAAGATGEAFKIIEQNLDFKIERRTQELKNFALVISQTFVQTFGGAVSSAIPSIKAIQQSVIGVAKFVRNFIIAPFELAFNFIRNGFNTLSFVVAKAIASIVNILSVTLVPLLNKLNIGKALAEKIKSAAETTKQTADKLFNDLSKSVDKTFEGTIFDKSDQFINNLQNNLDQAKSLVIANNEEIKAVTSGEDGDPVTNNIAKLGALGTAFQGLGEGFTNVAKSSEEALANLAKNAVAAGQKMRSGLANGISQGFAAFGAAIAKGENALDAFVKAFLSSLGQMAIQQGAFFILEGLGLQFVPGLQAQGAALIGVGAAMSALGGALTAISGGGGQGSFGAGGVGSVQTEPVLTQQQEREDPDTRVSVVFNGDIIGDGEESARKLITILNDGFESQGLVFNGAKTI